MPIDLAAQLQDAVARGSPAELSLPSDGMFRNYRTRFLGMDDHGLWMDGVPGEMQLIDQLVESGEVCPVTFKSFDTVVQFKAAVLVNDPAHALNSGSTVTAVLLGRPDQMAALQRRSAYRVKVANFSELAVTAWRVPQFADLKTEPNPATKLDLIIADLSATGIGILSRIRTGEHPIVATQRLRLLMQWKSDRSLIDTVVMSVRPADLEGYAAIGVKFKGLQDGIEGRRTEAMLDRILGQLSRAEMQRRKNAG